MGYDVYSTHLPALARAVHKLGGPVLELGAGWYSTPMIRALCDDVTTLENYGNWVSELSGVCGNSKIIQTQDFYRDTLPYLKKPWQIVFVDCDTAEQRVWAVSQLSNTVCIVGHDTENSYWAPCLAQFKYVKHWKFQTPHTSYMSNVLDVSTI